MVEAPITNSLERTFISYAYCSHRGERDMSCSMTRLTRVSRRYVQSCGIVILASAATFCLGSTPAQAQLNENCVISILNRTAQVQPDGSWRIANVPGSFGSLRARDLRRGRGDSDRPVKPDRFPGRHLQRLRRRDRARRRHADSRVAALSQEDETALAVVRGGKWGGLRGNAMGLTCVEVWGLANPTSRQEQTHD